MVSKMVSLNTEKGIKHLTECQLSVLDKLAKELFSINDVYDYLQRLGLTDDLVNVCRTLQNMWIHVANDIESDKIKEKGRKRE